MRAKTWTVVFIALLFPSILHARPPVTRLMNLYDPNTELVLEGRAMKNLDSQNLELGRPALIPLKLGHRKVLVILGPPWYVKDLGVKVRKGELIQVIGSKVYGPRGRLYIIARKIVLPERETSFTFRDENYIPNWRARRGPMSSHPATPIKPLRPIMPSFTGEGGGK